MCGCNDKKDEKLEKKEGSCGCGCGCDEGNTEEKSTEKTSCCEDKEKTEGTKESCCSDKNSCC